MSDKTLRCYYCQLDGKDELAHLTVHDRRGCKHVCIKHAKWRCTTSWMFGHSPDCPFHRNEQQKKETEA
jgi:hypothetical protein